MALNILLIWSLLSSMAHSQNMSNSVCTVYQHCTSMGRFVACLNLNSSLQLDTTNCASPPMDIQFIELIFTNKTIWDLNTKLLVDLVNLFSFHSSNFAINTNNLVGLDLHTFSLTRDSNHLPRFKSQTLLQIEDDSFPFGLYLNKEYLFTPDKCSMQVFQNMLSSDGENVFNTFGRIHFNNVNFKSAVCKYFFQNLSLNGLQLSSRLFDLMPTDLNSSQINSSIFRLSISSITKLNLDLRFLDHDVFKLINFLDIIQTSLHKIQDDMFKRRFNNLKSIYMQLINLKGFLHTGIAWIKCINFDHESVNLTKQNLINIKDVVSVTIYVNSDQNGTFSTQFFPFFLYHFPDEDFCLFYDVPIERLVFIQTQNLQNISCVIAWLYRFQSLYDNVILIRLNATFPVCNFTERVRLCRIHTIQYTDDPYFVFFYINQGLNVAKEVILKHVQPFVCGFGFITNLLVVLTVAYNHKRRQKIRAQPKAQDQEIVLLELFLYKYILLNSILNSIYTFMYLLDSLVPCVPGKPVIDDHIHYDTCIIKDMYLDTIGSILKLMSNFSLLEISVNRYTLIGKDHAEWLIRISQIRIKRFVIVAFISSAILSSVIYFQASLFVIEGSWPNTIYEGNQYYHYYYFSKTNEVRNKILTQSITQKVDEIPLLSSFFLVHDMFSYFLFCLAALVLDILTVKKLHDALENKKKIAKNTQDKKNVSSERKSIIMVVSSSLVNFIFRAPELLSIIFYYVVINDGGFVFKMVCFGYANCLSLVDISKVFYVMSLCFYLFFYVKFNSVFKCSFLVFINLLFSRFTRSNNQNKA